MSVPETSPVQPDQLYRSPNALAPHYGRFQVAERLLLTGHSHQAWPDRGFDGQRQAWLDAADRVDGKWEAAFTRADRVRAGFARLLGDTAANIALAASTHDLVVRWLSSLPLGKRPRIVTTDGEFHTLRRQLDRLAEAEIDVVKVAAHPAAVVGERLAAAIDDGTAAVAVSSVFFETAHVAGGLDRVAERCAAVGAELLVDAYHHLCALPFSATGLGLDGAWITGGGYKYCQLGEGNAFLRIPPGTAARPIVTGWYSEFTALEEKTAEGLVAYGPGPARFAGSTYDPTSHYRASEVFDFFAEAGLEPALLRAVSRHQVELLAERFDGLDLDPAVVDRDRSVPLERVGGFLALRSPMAGALCRALAERGVATDVRGDLLRLGPAPYLSDHQLEDAIVALGEVARAIG